MQGYQRDAQRTETSASSSVPGIVLQLRGEDQAIVSTTPPSTRNAAPVVAEA